jgi:hypothetical protein
MLRLDRGPHGQASEASGMLAGMAEIQEALALAAQHMERYPEAIQQLEAQVAVRCTLPHDNGSCSWQQEGLSSIVGAQLPLPTTCVLAFGLHMTLGLARECCKVVGLMIPDQHAMHNSLCAGAPS